MLLFFYTNFLVSFFSCSCIGYAGAIMNLVEEERMHHIGTWTGEVQNEELTIRIYRNIASTSKWKDTLVIQVGADGQEIKKLGKWADSSFFGSPNSFIPNSISGGGELFAQDGYRMVCRNLILYGIPEETQVWLE